MASTMFERYGGFAKVSRVVSAFYDKVLDSPILSPYFEHTDMRTQIDHQTKFVSALMGGPASYTDEELERKHAHLSVDERSFKEMMELLIETLEDFDFESDDIAAIRGEFSNRKRYIVK